MSHPYLFVIGCAIFGLLLPEVFAAFGNARVPPAMNWLSALAAALVSASFVL